MPQQRLPDENNKKRRVFLQLFKCYKNTRHACDGVKVISDHYVPSCYMNRNRYMVAQSQRVIAVYDGRDKGGTLFTLRDAHVQGREIRLIEI